MQITSITFSGLQKPNPFQPTQMREGGRITQANFGSPPPKGGRIKWVQSLQKSCLFVSLPKAKGHKLNGQ